MTQPPTNNYADFIRLSQAGSAVKRPAMISGGLRYGEANMPGGCGFYATPERPAALGHAQKVPFPDTLRFAWTAASKGTAKEIIPA
jgi:hypothetical protein